MKNITYAGFKLSILSLPISFITSVTKTCSVSDCLVYTCAFCALMLINIVPCVNLKNICYDIKGAAFISSEFSFK